MVRRSAEETAGQLGPFAHRAPPLDQLLVIARHHPAAVDPRIAIAVGRLGHEGQALQVFRPRLKIVKPGGGLYRVAERRMRRDIGDPLAVDIDGASVAQRAQMVLAGLYVRHVMPPTPFSATLHSRFASFETRPVGAPQDDEVPRVASKKTRHPEEARSAVSKDAQS